MAEPVPVRLSALPGLLHKQVMTYIESTSEAHLETEASAVAFLEALPAGLTPLERVSLLDLRPQSGATVYAVSAQPPSPPLLLCSCSCRRLPSARLWWPWCHQCAHMLWWFQALSRETLAAFPGQDADAAIESIVAAAKTRAVES